VRELDRAILHALRLHGHEPRIEPLVLGFTRAGEHGVLWHVLCLMGAALDSRRRAAYLAAMRVVALAYIANIALKYLVRRHRPRVEGLPGLSPTVTALSFPSAHSTTSFAAARSLSASGGLRPHPLYALACAMAVSRVYVGVHYPTDVAAGAALGTAIAQLLAPPAGRATR